MPAVAHLRQYEEQLAERVRQEQRRTGKERPQCFAVVELDLVREQLALVDARSSSAEH